MTNLWYTKLPKNPVNENYGEGNLYYFLKPLMYGDFLPTYNSYIYLGGDDKNNFVKFLKLLYQKNITIFGVKIQNNFDINSTLLHNGYYNYKLSKDLFKVMEIKKKIESEGIETTENETLPPKEFEDFLWFIRKPEIDNKFIVTVKCEHYKNQKFILNKETEHICSKCNFKNYFVSINSNSSDTYFNIKNCRVTLCHNHIKHKYGIELHRKYNDEQIKNKIEFTAKNSRPRKNINSVICFFSCDGNYNDVGNYIPITDDDSIINCEIRKVKKSDKSMYVVISTKKLNIGDELYLNFTNKINKISNKLEVQDCFKYGKLKKNALPNRITIGEVRKIQTNAPSVELRHENPYKTPPQVRHKQQAKSQAGPNESGGISNTLINLINTYDNYIDKLNKLNTTKKYNIQLLSVFVIYNYFDILKTQSEKEQLKLYNDKILPKFYKGLTPIQAGELIDLITENSENISIPQQTANRVLPAAYNNIRYRNNELNIRDYGGSGDCFFRALRGILSKFRDDIPTTIELRAQFGEFIRNELTKDGYVPEPDDLEFYINSFRILFGYDALVGNRNTIGCLRRSFNMHNNSREELLNQLQIILQNNYDQHKVTFANCFIVSMRDQRYYINEAQLRWSGDFIKSLQIPIEGLILMNLARNLSDVPYNNSTLYPTYSTGRFDGIEQYSYTDQQATNNILIFRTGDHFQAGFHLGNGLTEDTPSSYLFDRRIQHWTNANGFPEEDRVTIT